MYARIVRSHYDPAREVEVMRIAQDQLLPAYQRLPGFRSCTGGLDRAARQTCTVTIWETAEQAKGVRDALGDVLARFQDVGVVFDVAPEVYEITLQS